METAPHLNGTVALSAGGRRPAITPTGREVTFGTEEIIVSKTDVRGRITYVNDVFCRVSGYTHPELEGQPHSLIRHPDMPRVVFKALWDSVQAGREIFAYVLNLTRSGDAYWVFANVTPTFDGGGRIIGYHSNRRSPARSAVEKVVPLYAELLDIERAHASRAEGLAASARALDAMIARSHSSWESFVFSL